MPFLLRDPKTGKIVEFHKGDTIIRVGSMNKYDEWRWERYRRKVKEEQERAEQIQKKVEKMQKDMKKNRKGSKQ